MTRATVALLALLTGVSSASCAPVEGEDVGLEGEGVFRTKSCAFCHTVLAGEAARDPEAAAGDEEDRTKLSDLSNAGATFTAEGLRLFLVEGEEIGTRGHVTLFEGSDEEWAALAGWLLGFAASPDTSKAEMTREAPEDVGSTDTLRIVLPIDKAPDAALGNGSD